ncbi:hypothetical protein DYU11_11475 [Fibrisoma montanum]|uniref:Uncharacterized protein n=2 Tax=Fibrisoma montanum TaxID=2305895 RepID=A0A418MB63_9BACT|nr:hypothetical protein DYU11_11475 [Fibrisoma montanum]
MPVIPDHCEVFNDELISEIFFTDRAGALEADPTLAASWTPRLTNTGGPESTPTAIPHPIRHFKVVDGEKPIATLNYKTTRGGSSSILGRSTRTVTLVLEDDSDEMYELMTALQCNGNVLFAYRSGKHIYGMKAGAGGGTFIEAVIKPTYGIVSGTEISHRWQVTIEWSAKCEETRILAPI